RFSVLPAISLTGVLHLDMRARTYNGPLFLNFIHGLLDNMNPFPAPNSVIVMDNASFHKGEAVRVAIEAR
ncbi:hypothetical protein PENSPDRAFT_595645, partial [Peniophora sp. CONT]